MKKALSILLASAIAAAPLSVNVFAESEKNCGIRDALEKIITVYKGTCDSAQAANVECGTLRIVEKLAGLKNIDLGCILAGNCSTTENGCDDCGNGDAQGDDCDDGTCENEHDNGKSENPGNIIVDWEDVLGNIPPTLKPDTQIPDSETQNSGNVSVSVPSSEAGRVIELVNSYRAQHGLSPVVYDEAVSRAAQIRAEEQETLFSHTRPDGTSCFTALSESGASYRGAGENIAMGQTLADEVMDDWMNSQGHRENILNGSFTKIGVGLHIGNDGRYYWAQMFTY
ncbi:MAG: hypothetical protein IKV97_01830 [Clostridia bacterium]|nr:hypothetical protein [Clostridia bacterium]